jgi:hypothetical protein
MSPADPGGGWGLFGVGVRQALFVQVSGFDKLTGTPVSPAGHRPRLGLRPAGAATTEDWVFGDWLRTGNGSHFAYFLLWAGTRARGDYSACIQFSDYVGECGVVSIP